MRETTNAEEEKRKSAPAESERRMRETTNAEEEKRKTAQAQEQAALAQQKSSAEMIELENKRLQVQKDQNKAETEKHEQLQVNTRTTIEFEQKQIRLTEEAKQKTHNAEIAKFHMLNLVLETIAKMDREVALAVAPSLGAIASMQLDTGATGDIPRCKRGDRSKEERRVPHGSYLNISRYKRFELMFVCVAILGYKRFELQNIVEDHLKLLIVRNFDPKKADLIFTEEGSVGLDVPWLEDVISSPAMVLCL
eukprot:Em0018g821a